MRKLNRNQAAAALALAVALLFAPASLRAATAGKDQKIKAVKVNPKKIVSIDLIVQNLEAGDRMIPGRSYGYELRVHDHKGAVYSLREGSLSDEPLMLASPNLAIDTVARTLKAGTDKAATPDGKYSLDVHYGKKEPFEKTAAFGADYAFLEGPEPGDVQRLAVQLDPKPAFGLLAPGDALKADIVVTDKDGLTYRLGSGQRRLPERRVEITTESMTWNSVARTATASSDRAKLGDRGYRFTVRYRGRPDLDAELHFVPDFAAVDGPDAEGLKNLTISVDGMPSPGKLVPGQSATLVIEATDLYGRTFSTVPSAKLRLPATSLEISGLNVDIDPNSLALETDQDPKKMIGKNYKISVRFAGSETLASEAEFEPDFESPLAAFVNRSEELILRGEPGQPGANGGDGREGRPGSSSMAEYGTGRAGSSGTQGRPGASGARGGRGPAIRVTAAEVTTIDRDQEMVLFELRVGNGDPSYILRRAEDGPLRIVSEGGAGGPGGSGGKGGDGGKGGNGYSTGSGGAGGSGGDGGDGGDGGPGGPIQIVASSESAVAMALAESKGGMAGDGGPAGGRGMGGSTGSSSAAMVGQLAKGIGAILGGGAGYTPAPPPTPGSTGDMGQPGFEGGGGIEGDPGDVEGVVGDTSGLRDRIPEQLRRFLLFKDTDQQGSRY